MSKSVTVLLCAYNHVKFIEASLESIYNQDYRPFQLIVCDDGSSDETLKSIDSKIKNLPSGIEVSLVYNQTNEGFARILNRARSHIKGEIVVMQAGDDVAEPQRIRRIVDAFESDSNVRMVHSAHSVIDAYGRKVDSKPCKNKPSVLSFSKDFTSNPPAFLGATCAYAREAFTAFCPLDENLVQEDLVLPFRCMGLGSVVWLNEQLVRYRVHGGNVHFGGFTQSSKEVAARVIRLRLGRLAAARQAWADARRLQSLGRSPPAWAMSYLQRKICEADAESLVYEMKSPFTRLLKLMEIFTRGQISTNVTLRLMLLYVFPSLYSTGLKLKLYLRKNT